MVLALENSYCAQKKYTQQANVRRRPITSHLVRKKFAGAQDTHIHTHTHTHTHPSSANVNNGRSLTRFFFPTDTYVMEIIIIKT